MEPLTTTPSSPPPGPELDRLTVTGMVYHQAYNELPTLFESSYSQLLASTGGQPYKREVTVGEEWTELDTGWLDPPGGMVVVRNNEGKWLVTNPTPEERTEAAKRVVELVFLRSDELASSYQGTALDDADLSIPPGDFQRLIPASDRVRVWLRCRHGTAKVTVYVTPR